MRFKLDDITLKNAYRKLIFWGFTVIIVLMCSIIMFLSYFNNSFTSMYAEKMLQKHKYICENIIGYEYKLWQQGSFILGNTEVALVLNEADKSADNKYKAIKNINDIGTLLGVRSINIANESRNVFWSGTSLEEKNLDELENAEFGKYYEDYKSGNNFFVDREKNEIVYFYDDYRGYTVIFNINYTDFLDNMKYPQMEEVSVYYKNSNPLILNGTDNEKTLYEKIISGKKNENGSLKKGGKIYFYANINDVVCISGISRRRALKEACLNASFIWIFALILLIAVSVTMQYISAVLQKVRSAAEQTKNNRNETSIIKLFTNRETSAEEDEELSALFGKNKGYFAPFLIIVDGVNQKTDEKAICRLADAIFAQYGKAISVRISRHEIGTLYKTDDISNINEIIMRVKQSAEEQYGVTISIIKGKTTEEIGEMFGGTDELLKFASYRFIKGYGCIIDAENVHAVNSHAQYPIDIQRLIIESCKKGDLQSAEKQFKAFIDYIENNDYTMAENWTIMLFINIMRNMEQYENMIDFKTVNMIIGNDTFESSVNCFMNYLSEKFVLQNNEHETEFIKEIKHMVEKNYGNMEFDLNYVAREFGITSVHASRKFKKLTGQNFSKYLSEYRIEKARKSLVETELKISEIAEMCGFGSTTYFGSAFKKYTQMTPQEYRTKNK